MFEPANLTCPKRGGLSHYLCQDLYRYFCECIRPIALFKAEPLEKGFCLKPRKAI
jgi:hypothetical protein